VIFDEEYGSRLARAMGLANFSTQIADFDGLQTLVIERFDRVKGKRIHQEDFSQALGASGNQKYQEIGGVVSLRRVADTLQQHAQEEDRVQLARMVVLSIGVGNLDMHTKNIGILHSSDGNLRLAPAYDIVPQTHLAGVDGKVALSVNGTYRHDQLNSEDLVAEFASWGLRNARRLVSEGLADLRTAVAENSAVAGAHPQIQDRISRFVDNLIAGKSAGAV
jgi:serine/threonine-protein kinase HipA